MIAPTVVSYSVMVMTQNHNTGIYYRLTKSQKNWKACSIVSVLGLPKNVVIPAF
ncbi:hypothetical protein BZX65_24045 [Salmonella enterica subsp. enterica serovar Enteritidis]|nr:hypothetical protein [Salmonella enterica subsp. enterica serovar Enteritidis]